MKREMKKKTTKKRKMAATENAINMTPQYQEPNLGDVSKMAMQGAVLAGSLGMVGMMGGMLSNAFKK